MANNRPVQQPIVARTSEPATQDTQLVESTLRLVDDWLDWLKADGKSDATLRAYDRSLQQFTEWLEKSGNSGLVTPRTVLEFKGWLFEHYSIQTVNLRLSAVRSFYRWLVITERLPISPAESVSGLTRPNSRRHKRDPLSNGEVLAVLDVCRADQSLAGVRDRAMLTLMAYCGLRTVEVQRADLGHLKTQGDRMLLEVQGKGRKEADEVVVVPVSQEHVIREWVAHRLTFKTHRSADPLFVSLSNRNRGDRLTTRAIRAMVKSRYDAAGVVGPRKTAHSLRHSAITNAIRHGAKPMQVQSMARHSSFDTTLGYYHEEARTSDPAEDYVAYDTQRETARDDER